MMRGRLDSDPPEARPSSLVTLQESLDAKLDALSTKCSANVSLDGGGGGGGVGGTDGLGLDT